MQKTADTANTPEPAEELTRGHKKKARTRQLLVEAALRIYARRGASDLVLHELAAEAGMSHGTIYNYFKTREEVLEAVGIAVAEQLSEQILVLSTGISSGAERMAIAIRAFILRTKADIEWARALIPIVRYSEGMRAALASYTRRDLRTGKAQGEFKFAQEDVAIGLVISATTGEMTSIVEGLDVEGHDSVIAEMILLGLGVSPERAGKVARQPMPPLPELPGSDALQGRR